jgi:hypothetical protein
MDNDQDDDNNDDLIDNYYDDIIRRQTIARRTNWRMRFTSLSQREVALAAIIDSSIVDYGQFIISMIIIIDQIMSAIYWIRRHHFDRNDVRYNRSLHLFLYYNCLIIFCFYQLDSLLDQDDQLMNVRRRQWVPLAETPPRNRSIDELSDKDARSLTRFNKDQL